MRAHLLVAHDEMKQAVAGVRQHRLGGRRQHSLQLRRRALEALRRGTLLGVEGLLLAEEKGDLQHRAGRPLVPLNHALVLRLIRLHLAHNAQHLKHLG